MLTPTPENVVGLRAFASWNVSRLPMVAGHETRHAIDREQTRPGSLTGSVLSERSSHEKARTMLGALPASSTRVTAWLPSPASAVVPSMTNGPPRGRPGKSSSDRTRRVPGYRAEMREVRRRNLLPGLTTSAGSTAHERLDQIDWRSCETSTSGCSHQTRAMVDSAIAESLEGPAKASHRRSTGEAVQPTPHGTTQVSSLASGRRQAARYPVVHVPGLTRRPRLTRLQSWECPSRRGRATAPSQPDFASSDLPPRSASKSSLVSVVMRN